MTQAPASKDRRLTGVDYTVATHPRVSSMQEAAELRGVEVSAMVKTMVVRRGSDDYVFVLVPGDRVIDWPKLRSLLDERRLSMPDPDEALSVTGYERGSITPFAAATQWPVVADASLPGGTVSIGGGSHGVSLSIDGEDLVRVLSATVADVTRPVAP